MLKKATDNLGCIAISPDCQKTILGAGRSAGLWDLKSGMLASVIRNPRKENWPIDIGSAEFSPDGTHAICCSSVPYSVGGCIWLTNLITGQERIADKEKAGLWVRAAFSPTNDMIALYKFGSGYGFWAPDRNEVRSGPGTNLNGDAVAWMPNGRAVCIPEHVNLISAPNGFISQEYRAQLLAQGFKSIKNASVVLYDIETSQRMHTYLLPQSVQRADAVMAIGVSPDGQHVVAGTSRGALARWEMSSGRLLGNWDGATTTAIESLAMSPDGAFVVTSAGAECTLWNATSGAQLRSFKHPEKVTDARFGPEMRYVLTGSSDNIARFWDIATGQEVVRLIHSNDANDWLAVTPEGLFDSSVNAAKLMAYRIRGTLELAPLERFQQKYYRPGLLASILKGERPRAKIEIGKSLPPKVHITSPTGAGLDARSAKIEVHAVAESRGEQPLTSFKLLLDGRPYHGQDAIFRVDKPSLGTVRAKWSIELEPGKHRLKVLADTGYVQGASDELEVRYLGGQPEGIVELPSLYVLTIGVSKYAGTRKLDYAALDAEALADAYRQHSHSLFRNIEVKQITDEQATRKGIFEGLLWLREKMSQRSVGVVFFAGHGEKDQDGSLYFLPIDFEEKNLAGSALDADSLRKQLAGIPGRLTLILDACHSGQIGGGNTRGAGGLTDGLIRDLTAEENGMIVMCSTLGSEQAQESHTHRHGMFTVALLEGLAGQAKKTADGAVYLTALDAYVVDRVRELSKGQQHPVTSKPTTIRDFPVSKPQGTN